MKLKAKGNPDATAPLGLLIIKDESRIVQTNEGVKKSFVPQVLESLECNPIPIVKF